MAMPAVSNMVETAFLGNFWQQHVTTGLRPSAGGAAGAELGLRQRTVAFAGEDFKATAGSSSSSSSGRTASYAAAATATLVAGRLAFSRRSATCSRTGFRSNKQRRIALRKAGRDLQDQPLTEAVAESLAMYNTLTDDVIQRLAEDPGLDEEAFGEVFASVPDCEELAQAVQDMLEIYAERFPGRCPGYAAALRRLLQAGCGRGALAVYFEGSAPRRNFDADLHCGVLALLARFGQLTAALDLASDLSRSGVESSQAEGFFNAVLRGRLKAGGRDCAELIRRAQLQMDEAGVPPGSETLALAVYSRTQTGSPSFMADVGRVVLDTVRQHKDAFSRSLGTPAMTAVCDAHLRGGDVDAAYAWFVAGQLDEEREPLAETMRRDGRVAEVVSSLTRSLALNGQVLRLKRLLEKLEEQGGQLPSSVGAVSLSGHTCGRTLATVWLEPSPEVTRRRALWSDGGGLSVKCAEQFEWSRLDQKRHEVQQWSPYLAPDARLERAWLKPLRADDHGSLGLVRDWLGETPAAMAARERLEGSDAVSEAELAAVVERSLQVLPPCKAQGPAAPDTATVLGRAAYKLPKLRSWRARHCDAVHCAFLSPARFKPPSPEHFRQLMMSDGESRRMLSGKKADKPPLLPLAKIQEAVLAAPKDVRSHFAKMSFNGDDIKEKSCDVFVAELQKLGLEVSAKAAKSKIVEAAKFACKIAQMGDAAPPPPLSEDLQLRKAMLYSDEELQRKWREFQPLADTELLGEATSEAVAQRLLEELAEDEKVEGNAVDEVLLAVDIAELLSNLGHSLSSEDRHAILSAAQHVSDSRVAAEVLKALDELPVKAAARERAGLGAAGRELTKAMVQGGWEKNSVVDFLQGERPVPQRDPSTKLGSYLTPFLDPLKGASRESQGLRENMLASLTTPYERRRGDECIASDEAEDAVAESLEFPSRQDILQCAHARPEVTKGLLLAEGQGRVALAGFGPAKWLQELGLPQQYAKNSKHAEKVFKLVAETLKFDEQARKRMEEAVA
eukprot:TRINITY_DN33869_c0_g2_i1.p1 TRINITY_DN33869_c0_g2~~TRINITY_DN33869_c0_g2_i1.p1  ORF type:complete len:1014 (+),score=275.87 TRINITY_DN33869_c0_g2_i1:162-3203(+)